MPDSDSHPLLCAWQQFLNRSLDALLQEHSEGDAKKALLTLFQQVAETVPAYQDLLQEQGIAPASIQSMKRFRSLPLLTRETYILRYPLADLCRGGRLESCDTIAVSSGSTGQPVFWPRSLTDELQVAARFEQVLHDSFQADRRRTLAVVCFPLGTWVGGMYTAACCRHLAAKGYPLMTVTPGLNKEEIFRVVQELGPAFEQVVLLGYPPFVKDVIDTGLARGIDWPRYRIKLIFAGEVFSEEWRSLVSERVGSKEPCRDSASLYGTADAGVLGNETPLSICIRRFLAEHPEDARELFGESRLPTLLQFDPFSRYFETHEGTLLLSGDNGIPLIRYHIADTGGVIHYDEMLSFLTERGFDPVAAAAFDGARGIRRLPFVYLFGRSHFIVSYFGANIYPENISVGLEQPLIREWVTGKFMLQVREDEAQNARLFLAVELAPGVAADGAKRQAIANSVTAQLLRLNSEFAHYVPVEYRTPQIHLAPHGDPEYFPHGVKHRYTRA